MNEIEPEVAQEELPDEAGRHPLGFPCRLGHLAGFKFAWTIPKFPVAHSTSPVEDSCATTRKSQALIIPRFW